MKITYPAMMAACCGLAVIIGSYFFYESAIGVAVVVPLATAGMYVRAKGTLKRLNLPPDTTLTEYLAAKKAADAQRP